MSYKKYKIISIFFIFSLSFFTHNLYKDYNNFIFSILFPVNESVFEHLKMIFSTYILISIAEYIIVKSSKQPYNVLFSNIVGSIISIVFFLIIYIPIFLNFNHNLFVTLIIYFISIIIGVRTSYLYVSNFTHKKQLTYISIILLILIYYLFYHFTYNPCKNTFFLDTIYGLYGINTYISD